MGMQRREGELRLDRAEGVGRHVAVSGCCRAPSDHGGHEAGVRGHDLSSKRALRNDGDETGDEVPVRVSTGGDVPYTW